LDAKRDGFIASKGQYSKLMGGISIVETTFEIILSICVKERKEKIFKM
jgi:hypothetical protein